MKARRLKLSASLIVALVAVAAMGGCTKKIAIAQYPVFYDENIKVIAVTPFRNQTNAKDAGNIISDKLSALLIANGTYKIYNRNDYRVLSDERDLQLELGQDPQKVEAIFARFGDVDAILTGVVSTYSGTTRNERRKDPIYRYNAQTRTNYIAGYRTYVHTRNEANVAATAALLRRDGSTIYATPVPVHAQYWAQGSPPKKDVYALVTQGSNAVAAQLLEHFAIVRKTIKVDPQKALQTASELYEDKWNYTDRFSREADKMYVVVALPKTCDRNRFVIRIVRKDQREYLSEQQITWDGKYKGYGYLFNPQEIFAQGGGAGAYTAKFYSGPSPVFTRDFHIH
ncbi:MAG: CsgG/HfaB family protein [Planctomycetota bacterium]|jgi:hypothetical protein